MATPPDDAYGRVTDAERYGALQSSADALVDSLSRRFVLEVVRTPELDPSLWRDYRLTRVARLEPAGGGAPITIGWTDFPGLAVWFGNWTEERYPQCGCDACDEDVDDLRDLLARQVESVTSGVFAETLERSGWRSWAFIDSSGRTLDTRRRSRPFSNTTRGESAWRPWVRR
jgi:hypothetical protein